MPSGRRSGWKPDHPERLCHLALPGATRCRKGAALDLFRRFLRVPPPTLARERQDAAGWIRTSGTWRRRGAA